MINKTKKEAGILNNFFPKNQGGISGVVTVVILIALVVVLVSIVWVAVQGLVEDKLGSAEACLEVFEKVKINSRYTCYEKRIGTENLFKFSITRGDIDLDKILVSISSEGEVKTFEIPGTYDDVKNYKDVDYGGVLTLPEKNAGLTYISQEWSEKPDLVEISLVIDGIPCQVSGSLSDIDFCTPSE